MTLEILWTIAGFGIGWIGIDLAICLPKVKKIPLLINFIVGLIGSLTAYTIYNL